LVIGCNGVDWRNEKLEGNTTYLYSRARQRCWSPQFGQYQIPNYKRDKKKNFQIPGGGGVDHFFLPERKGNRHYNLPKRPNGDVSDRNKVIISNGFIFLLQKVFSLGAWSGQMWFVNCLAKKKAEEGKFRVIRGRHVPAGEEAEGPYRNAGGGVKKEFGCQGSKGKATNAHGGVEKKRGGKISDG